MLCLIFLIPNSYLFCQKDTVEISLKINNRKVEVDRTVKVSLIDSAGQYCNDLNNLIIIDTNRLNSKYVAISFSYKSFKFYIKKIGNFFKNRNAEITIVSKGFDTSIKDVQKLRFIYYIKFIDRLNDTQLNETLKKGILHPVLRTANYFVYKDS